MKKLFLIAFTILSSACSTDEMGNKNGDEIDPFIGTWEVLFEGESDGKIINDATGTWQYLNESVVDDTGNWLNSATEKNFSSLNQNYQIYVDQNGSEPSYILNWNGTFSSDFRTFSFLYEGDNAQLIKISE